MDAVSLPSSEAPTQVSLPPDSDEDSDGGCGGGMALPVDTGPAASQGLSEGDVVSLPPSDGEMDSSSRKCGCTHKCFQKFDCMGEKLAEWKAHRMSLRDEDVSTVVHRMLYVARHERNEKFMLLGQCICKGAFRQLTSIGGGKLTKLIKSVEAGELNPPPDMRHDRFVPETKMRAQCHAWFQQAWEDAAEYMAEEGHEVEEFASVEAAQTCDAPYVVDGFCEWVIGPCSTANLSAAARGDMRRIPYQSWSDLYELFRADMAMKPEAQDESIASMSTFLREYADNWFQSLRFRKESQQSKCPDCELFKAYRRLAKSALDHSRITESYHTHLKGNVADRKTDKGLCDTSERYCAGIVARIEAALRSHSDGVDQAKLELPRNTTASKDFSGLWRPRMMMIGTIVWGLQEGLYFMDADIVKEANLECTLWARMLQTCSEQLSKKGMEFPAHWSHHIDNAAGEGNLGRMFDSVLT